MNESKYDLVVIGAGPGGEVAAIKASQLGFKVAIIDKRKDLGGTCLNVGCIPTKSLLESAKTWKKIQKARKMGFPIENPIFDWTQILDCKNSVVSSQRKGLLYLMKKNKVTVYQAKAALSSSNTVELEDNSGSHSVIKAKFILLATGSAVRELPFVKVDGKNIHSSDTVLDIQAVPKTMAIIGGGVVGMEFASLFSSFGCKVTVIELGDQITPSEDPECARELSRYLKKQDVDIQTKTELEDIKVVDNQCYVKTKGKPEQCYEKVLLSIGRRPVSENLGLEKLNIKTNKGYIQTDSHYRTSVENIFAIGDVINTPGLAHTASAEAIHAIEIMANKHPKAIDYDCNPSAIYTYPEIASIGKTETKLKDLNIEFKTAKFPFSH